MGAYEQLVTAIEEYNVKCLANADSDCTAYDMKWNVDVGLEQPINGDEWWTANIQFETWANYRQGVIFYKQIDDANRAPASPTTDVINQFVKFFEYPCRRQGQGSGSGCGSSTP